ncbi:LppP/LprE family lipoprotein [Gordonia sp. (in: high G+C Gram-positive bacteria)]|uniref:LppP/LprE family lipoprotein n=1 Tax=Gordonia sp. (in: high G+C Gram-positive bacteria) TaxID=84139 RepID=UPI003341BD66
MMNLTRSLAVPVVGSALLLCVACGPASDDEAAGTVAGTSTSDAVSACDPDEDHSAAITEALASLPTRWEWSDEVALTDPCAPLSAATARVKMPTVTSPEGVLLFSRGRFVGQVNKCAYMLADDVSVNDYTATVSYRFRKPDDSAQAGLSGRESVTYTYDPETGNISDSGYSAELTGSQPTCDPATGTWTAASTTTTTSEQKSCVNDLVLDLVVSSATYSNGTELDGAPQYILRVKNNGESTCRVLSDAITLDVTGPNSAQCHPQVQGIEMPPGQVQVLDSRNGAWGTCASGTVNGPGMYTLAAQISNNGSAVTSNSGSFKVAG